jgi:hypothetical protein
VTVAGPFGFGAPASARLQRGRETVKQNIQAQMHDFLKIMNAIFSSPDRTGFKIPDTE